MFPYSCEERFVFQDEKAVIRWCSVQACSTSPLYYDWNGSMEVQINTGDIPTIYFRSQTKKRVSVTFSVTQDNNDIFSGSRDFDRKGITLELPNAKPFRPIVLSLNSPKYIIEVPDEFKRANFKSVGIPDDDWDVITPTVFLEPENEAISDIYSCPGFNIVFCAVLDKSGFSLHGSFVDVTRPIRTTFTVELFSQNGSQDYCASAKSYLIGSDTNTLCLAEFPIDQASLPSAGVADSQGYSKFKVSIKLPKRTLPKIEMSPVPPTNEPEFAVFRSREAPKNTVIPRDNCFSVVHKIPVNDAKNAPFLTEKYVCDGVSYTATLNLKENKATFEFDFDREHAFVRLAWCFVDNSGKMSKTKHLEKVCAKEDNKATTTLPLSLEELEDKKWVFEDCYLVHVALNHVLREVRVLPTIPVKPTNDTYSMKWEIPVGNLSQSILNSALFAIDTMKVSFRLLQSKDTVVLGMSFRETMSDFMISVKGTVGTIPFHSDRVVSMSDPGIRFDIIDAKSDKKLEDFVVDGLLCVTASIIYERPRYSFVKLEKKSEETQELRPCVTEYVGLMNQGATCYMNSILQALFHTPAFRKVVYNMETTGLEDPEKSIPLTLQRLFCEMQLSTRPCSTKSVTKSFGWGSEETFIQHDVQEFLRVLMDNLEKKMKGTPLENAIPDIFRGTMRNYIRCVNVPYESTREEAFMDLSMDVKGCRTLYDSFKRYTTPERLEGDNQYSTDDFGKQDADMGVELYKLPPVLHLQLRRFQYDYATDHISKVVDRFEFPAEIDLTEFLAKDSPDKNRSNIFDLYGVLVHSGGVYGGHYYAYLRTTTDVEWYLFNDSRVSHATIDEAIYRNYGANQVTAKSQPTSTEFDGLRRSAHYSLERKHRTTTHSAHQDLRGSTQFSGYMLVYIRRDDAPFIMEPIPDESVPQHLKDYVQHQKEQEVSVSVAPQGKDEDITVKYTLEDSLKDLASVCASGFIAPEAHELKISRTVTTSELYKLLRESSGKNSIRVWLVEGYSRSLSKVIPCSDTELFSKSSWTSSTNLFVQTIPEDEPIPVPSDEHVIFTKFYFPEEKTPIQYVMPVKLKKTATFAEVGNVVKKRLGFPDDTPLQVYIETFTAVKNHGINEMLKGGYLAPTMVIFQCPPGTKTPTITTDFVLTVAEPEVSPKESDEIHYNFTDFAAVPVETVDRFVQKRKTLDLDVYGIDDTSKKLFRLTVPESCSVDLLKRTLPQIAGVDFDPLKDVVTLAKESTSAYLSGMSVIDSKASTVNYIFYSSERTRKLIFGITKDVAHGAELVLCGVQVWAAGKPLRDQFAVMAQKEGTCNSFVNQVCSPKGIEGTFRMLMMHQNEVKDIVSGEERYKMESSYNIPVVRLEKVPEDQLNIDIESEMLAKCYMCVASGSTIRAYEPLGTVFVVVVKKDEPFSETKKRMFPYMNLNDEEQMKNFVFKVKPTLYSYETSLIVVKDDDTLYDKMVGKKEAQLMIICGFSGKPAAKGVKSRASASVTIYN